MFSSFSASPGIGSFQRVRDSDATGDTFFALGIKQLCCYQEPGEAARRSDTEGSGPDPTSRALDPGRPKIRFFNPRNVTYLDPPYTVYPFEVEYKSLNLRWRIKKRYSEFAKLQKKLSEEVNADLPSLPSKTWRRDTSEAFINERKKLLEEYMLTLCNIPQVVACASFMVFLGLIEDQTKIRADRKRMHIDSYIQEAQTGDIVLFKTAGILSGALRGVTNCEFDHVAVVIRTCHDPQRPKINLLEATTDGVVRYDCWQRLSQWNMVDAKICVRQLHVERDREFQRAAEKFMMDVDGLDYQLTLSKLFRKKSVDENAEEEVQSSNQEEDKEETYFCSELIATLYKNWKLLDRSIASAQYWPSSFSSKNKSLNLLQGELTNEIDIYFQKPAIDRARICL